MSSPFPSPTYSTPTIDSTECANQRPVLLEDQQTFTSLLGDMSPANTSSPNTLSAIPTACAWCAPSGAEHGGYCDHQVPLRNGVSATPALHPTEIPPNVAGYPWIFPGTCRWLIPRRLIRSRLYLPTVPGMLLPVQCTAVTVATKSLCAMACLQLLHCIPPIYLPML
ncbi:hypothetical protein EDD21DRAFT_371850 [Dissophora ornata]|nr:hypothetical protein EDD21DRAFT_371850 [Dissophora ornata]